MSVKTYFSSICFTKQNKKKSINNPSLRPTKCTCQNSSSGSRQRNPFVSYFALAAGFARIEVTSPHLPMWRGQTTASIIFPEPDRSCGPTRRSTGSFHANQRAVEKSQTASHYTFVVLWESDVYSVKFKFVQNL